MKKYIFIVLAVIMPVFCVSGCGNSANKSITTDSNEISSNSKEIFSNSKETSSKETSSKETSASEKKLSIVTTIFPEYDWTKEILGERADDVELTMLLDNGVDLHSYQPTAEDIMKISSCDIFIYVGGESDAWVEDALKEATNKDMKVINLLEVLGDNVKEEEIVEGMEADEEEEAEGEKEKAEGKEAEGKEEKAEGEEEPEYDEHVWLSLKNAEVFCNAIEKVLAEIDSKNADIYQKNTAAYIEKLKSLDEAYQSAVDGASQKTLLFGDRFPFRYLADDYGLSYYATFIGCSAETEASFETISFLAQKVDELGLHSVMKIEKSDQKIAKTIIKNITDKNQNILELDSMQGTTIEDVLAGATYFSVMEHNLSVLKEALQ